MMTNYPNRAVRIVKGVPGHPTGSIRTPRKEQAEQWIRMGVAEYVDRGDLDAITRAAAGGELAGATVIRKKALKRKTKAKKRKG